MRRCVVSAYNKVCSSIFKFETQTMKAVAEAFGPLEYFKIVSSAAATGKCSDTVPPGHRSRRTKVMDGAVWEVKWGHRDDCITAFNVRKVLPSCDCIKALAHSF